MDCAKCRKWSRSCMEIQTVPLSLCPVPSQQLLHKIKTWNWFQLLDCWDQCRYSAAAPVNVDFESLQWLWAWNGAKSESKKLCEKMWMRRNRYEERNWFSEAHVMWFARRACDHHRWVINATAVCLQRHWHIRETLQHRRLSSILSTHPWILHSFSLYVGVFPVRAMMLTKEDGCSSSFSSSSLLSAFVVFGLFSLLV